MLKRKESGVFSLVSVARTDRDYYALTAMPKPVENDSDKTELHTPSPSPLPELGGKRRGSFCVETSSMGKGRALKRPQLCRELRNKDLEEADDFREETDMERAVAKNANFRKELNISSSVLLTTLQRYFGYSSFREGQEAAVKAVVDGRDALVIMPTGLFEAAMSILAADGVTRSISIRSFCWILLQEAGSQSRICSQESFFPASY